jgi:hypothetical protein
LIVASPRDGSLVSWSRVTGSLALVAAGAVAALWVAFPHVVVLWVLLLVALILIWLVRTPPSERARAVTTMPLQDPVDVAMRTRLASAQAELSSLRGVQRELLAARCPRKPRCSPRANSWRA